MIPVNTEQNNIGLQVFHFRNSSCNINTCNRNCVIPYGCYDTLIVNDCAHTTYVDETNFYTHFCIYIDFKLLIRVNVGKILI